MDRHYQCQISAQDNDLVIYTPPLYAILLHPSLGAPAIVRPDSELAIYYLIHEDMYQGYLTHHPSETVIADSIFLRRIVSQTGIVAWQDLIKNPEHHKIIGGVSQAWLREDRDALASIRCSVPEYVDLSGTNQRPVFLRNESGVIVAKIEPLILHYYHKRGYQYWVRLDVGKHNLKPGLYNISWNALHPIQSGHLSNRFLEPMEQAASMLYEPQDEILHQMLQDKQSSKEKCFHVPESAAFCYEQKDFKIESLHPLYVIDREYLNTGHVTDIHISSQQYFFKRVQSLQVLPGADQEDSPSIAEVINTNFENVKTILDQMGKNPRVDVVLITGDLIDFSKSLDPTTAPIQTLLDLWQAPLNPDSHFEKGIDTLVMYSLVRYFHDRYEKPVLMVIGNHDAYEYPFGISPRIGLKQLSALGPKVNPGIPCDHNLTFQEALLLYGPNFRVILKHFNFNYSESLFFYALFNACSDFNLSYHKQVFTGLGWGESESFVEGALFGGGALPRANDSLTGNQLKILSHANDWKRKLEAEYHILFMHAPFINYDQKIPLSEQGCVYHSENWSTKSHGTCYETGSVTKNRHAFFARFIENNQLTHCYSGHSHRAGIYHILWKGLRRFSEVLYTSGACLQEGATLPKRTHFIVSASAGPLPIKNRQGEFLGLGLDCPSGTTAYYSVGGPDRTQYEVLPSSEKTAQPRMCVLFDYFIVTEVKESCFSGELTLEDWRRSFLKLRIHPKVEHFLGTPLGFSHLKFCCLDLNGGEPKLSSSPKLVVNVENDGLIVQGLEIARMVRKEKTKTKSCHLNSHCFLLFYFEKNSIAFEDYSYCHPWIGMLDITFKEHAISVGFQHNVFRQEFPPFDSYLAFVRGTKIN